MVDEAVLVGSLAASSSSSSGPFSTARVFSRGVKGVRSKSSINVLARCVRLVVVSVLGASACASYSSMMYECEHAAGLGV